MSVIDNLVYDRTQADVDRVFTLKNKILMGGLSALSNEEKAEYMAGMKGAYNYTDMNRVGQAVAYIAGRMTALPGELDAYRAEKGVGDDPNYEVPYDPSTVVVSAKTDWAMGDTPTQSLVATFLNNLTVLRKQLVLPNDAPAVPSSLDQLTFSTANDIEYLLYVIYQTFLDVEATLYRKIDYTVAMYAYTGISYCGE